MIVELINRLRDRYRIGVIEGDIAGQVDADKIHAHGDSRWSSWIQTGRATSRP